MLQNDYPFWIFSMAISRRVIKILAYNEGVLNRHRPRAVGYLNSGFTCQQIRCLNSLNSQHGWIFNDDIEWLRFSYRIILFKSWIANMAGFLLWLSITYDWGFQSRFSATAIIFINGHDLFYNGGNSPESLQAYDPALGGYIIQVEVTSNMQVPCHCQHAPWHLGANAKSFFHHLIEDPTHHIVMSRPLGATNCSCRKFKVNKP